jgi:hypothetical protein
VSARKRRGLLGSPWPAAIAVLSVAVLLTVPTGAGASSVVHALKHVAPFSGTPHVGSVVTRVGCGASAGFSVAPAFNLTSGIGISFGNSSAKGCGPPGFSDFGSTEGTTGFDSTPYVEGPPVPSTFSVTYNFSFAYNLTATPQNPAGGPFAWAAASFASYAYLWDATNSSVVVWCGYGYPFLTTNGTASGHVSGLIVGPFACLDGLRANQTAVGHQYVVELYSVVWEGAYAPSSTTTHATARINMGTAGHHYKPISWKVA